MEREIALEIKDLHISYKCLKSFSIKKSLLHMKKADAKVYEAVRGVSFSVPKGEILTGRENIVLSGMLLGFSEEQVRAKMDEIIEFANLGEFIDMPVKTYSSGMHSKLAFSITAILEADIMLIDEVLSVGDAKFKKKSYNKMKELISNEDRTVLIVSHSSETLKELCTSVLWLHEGEMKMIGKPEEVLPAYDKFMS